MHFTLRQLEALLAVADTGSFTRAAEHLHLTPSAVSQLIQELESAVGYSVFERSTRKVVLSAAGRALIPVVEALDQMGLWVLVLPEWEAVRSKPQRNAYHRFTVDRHLMEACANAAGLVARTDRPDLLVPHVRLRHLLTPGLGPSAAARPATSAGRPDRQGRRWR